MPVVSYLDFSGGLDSRLPINVQESNRLLTLTNAYITTGKKIRKRPGLVKTHTGLSGSFGLSAAGGTTPQVYAEVGFPAPPGVLVARLEHPASVIAPLIDVVYAEPFQGFYYVIAKYAAGAYRHHYVDANPLTLITDVNCPHYRSATKAASRIFATNESSGDVYYTAAGDARDWTTASDAGFIPTNIQADETRRLTAVGTYQDALAVMYEAGIQIWDVAVDPTANAIRKRLFGVGCHLNGSGTLGAFSSDLAFLSPSGVRSMVVSAQTDRIDDNDLGSPIDPQVIADIATASNEIRGIWLPPLGQYWLIFDKGSTSNVWVYSFSKSSKLGAWSKYTFPISIKGIDSFGTSVYLRSDNDIYLVSDTAYTDDGVSIPVDVQMAFQDAKTPGVDKQWDAADFALIGSPAISYLYDPRDLGKESTPYTISGDTRAGDLNPVEIVSPAIAPHFVHEANEAFEIDATQLYFQTLKA